jgi:hypothetical protein
MKAQTYGRKIGFFKRWQDPERQIINVMKVVEER